MDQVAAPWTQAQIDALNRYQRAGDFHPFTCGNDRGDQAHRAYAAANDEPDLGLLVATPGGWICPVCDYRQGWAHPFMLEDPSNDPSVKFLREMRDRSKMREDGDPRGGVSVPITCYPEKIVYLPTVSMPPTLTDQTMTDEDPSVVASRPFRGDRTPPEVRHLFYTRDLMDSETYVSWWIQARDRYFDHDWLVEPPVSWLPRGIDGRNV